ncbi:MAG: isoprenyl transferase [Lactobacillales bacterium]|nr:isoprenyl transferase [Lactobacillales bacterium]
MFPWFSKKEKKIDSEVKFEPEGKIPKHIAIIMDGNGRWASKRKLPRIAGHKEGMEAVKKVTTAASKLGVKVLTLYAFSTENWKRPDKEVKFLMKLPIDFFDHFVPELVKENVQVKTMGYVENLPAHTQDAVINAIEKTKDNTGMILNFALNYGGRAELLTTFQLLAKEVKNENLSPLDVSEEKVNDALMTGFLEKEFRDPELLIRTSGEERISNFLLWQLAYSEFYFTEELWPDFDGKSLKYAIAIFQKRNRRFGGL